MILTRDQLRAARMLLRLNQDELAELSRVGVATLRRFEGGQDIGALHREAIQRTIEAAGAVLLEPHGRLGAGVALQLASELPPETLARLAAAGDGAGDGAPRRAGRPRRKPG